MNNEALATARAALAVANDALEHLKFLMYEE